MTRRLILARHGNTFSPTDKPVWVGARSDLPLVAKGLSQAHKIGLALIKNHIKPGSITCAPLLRTRETANIVAQLAGLDSKALIIDHRLTEIDYGAWEGLSTEEIIGSGGGEELAAWNSHSVFPRGPKWSPDEAVLTLNVSSFLSELQGGTHMAVTSNGILRYFARHAINFADFGDWKVATGHVCIMRFDRENWHLAAWNVPPEALSDQH